MVSASRTAVFRGRRALFVALFHVKKKLAKRTIEDRLFEHMPNAIQEAQRKLQHEQRLRKRAAWKANQKVR